ncbi:hypothetical protein HUU05_17115 [candidate division KSB1 bacterium]|nr:hypothetical protein [candidate division KSB1 bacterium]
MSQTFSLIYSNQFVYQLAIRLLFGRHFRARYEALAAEIPNSAQVVDVCAGDCYLYRRFLRKKGVQYLGLELSPHLVRAARAQGVSVEQFDIRQDEIPSAEFVVMQGSLYQFLPNVEVAVHKMLAAARRKVIIAEPIRNLSSEDNWLGKASRILTQPDANSPAYAGQRFNEQSLQKLFDSFATFERAFLIPGGREMIGVFRGRGKEAL